MKQAGLRSLAVAVAPLVGAVGLGGCSPPAKTAPQPREHAEQVSSLPPAAARSPSQVCADPDAAGMIRKMLFDGAQRFTSASSQPGLDLLREDSVVTLNTVVVDEVDPSLNKVSCAGELDFALGPRGQARFKGARGRNSTAVSWTVQPAADGSGDVYRAAGLYGLERRLAEAAFLVAIRDDHGVIRTDDGAAGVQPAAGPSTGQGEETKQAYGPVGYVIECPDPARAAAANYAEPASSPLHDQAESIFAGCWHGYHPDERFTLDESGETSWSWRATDGQIVRGRTAISKVHIIGSDGQPRYFYLRSRDLEAKPS